MIRRDFFKSLVGLIAAPALVKIEAPSAFAGRTVLGSVIPSRLSTIGFSEIGPETLLPMGDVDISSRVLEVARPIVNLFYPDGLPTEESTTMIHKEAFCLMWYRCDECGHKERIWNSRDGVTPFGCACPSCGGLTLYHTEFDKDVAVPDHKLHRGQKFWRDGTPEEAIRIVQKRLEFSKSAGRDIPPEYEDQIIEAANDGLDEWAPGWPYLDVKGDD